MSNASSPIDLGHGSHVRLAMMLLSHSNRKDIAEMLESLVWGGIYTQGNNAFKAVYADRQTAADNTTSLLMGSFREWIHTFGFEQADRSDRFFVDVSAALLLTYADRLGSREELMDPQHPVGKWAAETLNNIGQRIRRLFQDKQALSSVQEDALEKMMVAFLDVTHGGDTATPLEKAAELKKIMKFRLFCIESVFKHIDKEDTKELIIGVAKKLPGLLSIYSDMHDREDWLSVDMMKSSFLEIMTFHYRRGRYYDWSDADVLKTIATASPQHFPRDERLFKAWFFDHRKPSFAPHGEDALDYQRFYRSMEERVNRLLESEKALQAWQSFLPGLLDFRLHDQFQDTLKTVLMGRHLAEQDGFIRKDSRKPAYSLAASDALLHENPTRIQTLPEPVKWAYLAEAERTIEETLMNGLSPNRDDKAGTKGLKNDALIQLLSTYSNNKIENWGKALSIRNEVADMPLPIAMMIFAPNEVRALLLHDYPAGGSTPSWLSQPWWKDENGLVERGLFPDALLEIVRWNGGLRSDGLLNGEQWPGSGLPSWHTAAEAYEKTPGYAARMATTLATLQLFYLKSDHRLYQSTSLIMEPHKFSISNEAQNAIKTLTEIHDDGGNIDSKTDAALKKARGTLRFLIGDENAQRQALEALSQLAASLTEKGASLNNEKTIFLTALSSILPLIVIAQDDAILKKHILPEWRLITTILSENSSTNVPFFEKIWGNRKSAKSRVIMEQVNDYMFANHQNRTLETWLTVDMKPMHEHFTAVLHDTKAVTLRNWEVAFEEAALRKMAHEIQQAKASEEGAKHIPNKRNLRLT